MTYRAILERIGILNDCQCLGLAVKGKVNQSPKKLAELQADALVAQNGWQDRRVDVLTRHEGIEILQYTTDEMRQLDSLSTKALNMALFAGLNFLEKKSIPTKFTPETLEAYSAFVIVHPPKAGVEAMAAE